MSAGPGFVFWGLFVCFGALVVGYVVWMRWIERRERSGTARSDTARPERSEPPG